MRDAASKETVNQQPWNGSVDLKVKHRAAEQSLEGGNEKRAEGGSNGRGEQEPAKIREQTVRTCVR